MRERERERDYYSRFLSICLGYIGFTVRVSRFCDALCMIVLCFPADNLGPLCEFKELYDCVMLSFYFVRFENNLAVRVGHFVVSSGSMWALFRVSLGSVWGRFGVVWAQIEKSVHQLGFLLGRVWDDSAVIVAWGGCVANGSGQERICDTVVAGELRGKKTLEFFCCGNDSEMQGQRITVLFCKTYVFHGKHMFCLIKPMVSIGNSCFA